MTDPHWAALCAATDPTQAFREWFDWDHPAIRRYLAVLAPHVVGIEQEEDELLWHLRHRNAEDEDREVTLRGSAPAQELGPEYQGDIRELLSKHDGLMTEGDLDEAHVVPSGDCPWAPRWDDVWNPDPLTESRFDEPPVIPLTIYSDIYCYYPDPDGGPYREAYTVNHENVAITAVEHPLMVEFWKTVTMVLELEEST